MTQLVAFILSIIGIVAGLKGAIEIGIAMMIWSELVWLRGILETKLK